MESPVVKVENGRDADVLFSDEKLQVFERVCVVIHHLHLEYMDWWKHTIRSQHLVHFPSPSTGLNLLHTSAYHGRIEAVQFLLDEGADIDSTDLLGHTALWLASFKGNIDVVNELLRRGASIHKISLLCSKDCLQIASEKGHMEVAAALLLASKKDQVQQAPRTVRIDRELIKQQIDEVTRMGNTKRKVEGPPMGTRPGKRERTAHCRDEDPFSIQIHSQCVQYAPMDDPLSAQGSFEAQPVPLYSIQHSIPIPQADTTQQHEEELEDEQHTHHYGDFTVHEVIWDPYELPPA